MWIFGSCSCFVGIILACDTVSHIKSFMRESSIIAWDSYLGWVQNLKKVMIHSDTKGTGKGTSIFDFCNFFYGKKKQCQKFQCTAQWEETYSLLDNHGFWQCITVASCFWASVIIQRSMKIITFSSLKLRKMLPNWFSKLL